MKKAIKIVLRVLLVLVIIAAAYVAYVFIAYHRIGSGPITAEGEADGELRKQEQYTLASWNIGFGAYTADYDFFMDGGSQSWAESSERLDANMSDICGRIKEFGADILLLQEVDTDSTRTYHLDESELIIDAVGEGYAHTFAQNYDSPFLFYPITEPHGISRSGLLTFSAFDITEAGRVELPIEDTVMKLLDLDRCYSVNRIPLADGGELVLYNLHLSAYTSDGTIANEQLRLLAADLQAEFEKGNYCIAGGDFNKDLLGDSSAYFGETDSEYIWAQPIPEGLLDEYGVSLIAPVDVSLPVPSCRNPDSAYHEGQYVVTVDGFMVTGNVSVEACEVLDYGFAYSDHNPVRMVFILK